MLDALRQEVYRMNMELADSGLVVLSWGNVSGIDRDKGLVAIKPSGVAYRQLKVADIVIVDLDGNLVEGALKPSSDTPTHLQLYRAFPGIGGVCHTHSLKATAWAQAGRPIPCLGTTHADYFHGPVPVTRMMSEPEVRQDYELNTGKVIVETYKDMKPELTPAVLVAGHGPFTWAATASQAVRNAVVLEYIAGMAMDTDKIQTNCRPIPSYLLDRHYFRKHGKNAYYGQ